MSAGSVAVRKPPFKRRWIQVRGVWDAFAVVPAATKSHSRVQHY